MTQPPGPGPDEQPPPPYGRPPTFGPPGRHAPGYQPPPPPPGYYSPGYYAPGSGYYGPPTGAYPPPAYYPPYYYAPRPGCVPLRPLGLGDILDGAFKVIRRNPKVVLGLSAMVAVVEAVITSVGLYASLRSLRHIHFGSTTTSAGIGFDPSQLVSTVVGFLAAGMLTGMLTLVVTQDVLGRRLTLGETWAQVRPRIWTLLGLTLITALVPAIGLIFCIVPGVWLWGIWTVAVPACMVERIGVRASLRRSKGLVDGTFWRVWGIRALGYLITSAVSWLIMAPFVIGGLVVEFRSVDSTGSTIWAVVMFSVASLIARTFTAPVQAGIDALLYVDLRMRREGLDIALQQAVATPPAAGPVAAD